MRGRELELGRLCLRDELNVTPSVGPSLSRFHHRCSTTLRPRQSRPVPSHLIDDPILPTWLKSRPPRPRTAVPPRRRLLRTSSSRSCSRLEGQPSDSHKRTPPTRSPTRPAINTAKVRPSAHALQPIRGGVSGRSGTTKRRAHVAGFHLSPPRLLGSEPCKGTPFTRLKYCTGHVLTVLVSVGSIIARDSLQFGVRPLPAAGQDVALLKLTCLPRPPRSRTGPTVRGELSGCGDT